MIRLCLVAAVLSAILLAAAGGQPPVARVLLDVSGKENHAASSERPVFGRDIHVGRDKDAPTIGHAIKVAQPGDTIHLEPGKIYYESAGFHGKKGKPGQPITLDGHGATLNGSEPLDPAPWSEVSPGLFVAENPVLRLNDAMLARWYFLFDGKMQLMGRTSKGRKAPWKQPETLEPGQWTFVPVSAEKQTDAKRTLGRFFLKLEPGRLLADANIRVPVRSAGVQFSGDNAHLVIRNVTATHVYNDGFNIHGDCRDVVFQNIRAIECGDDGISAHASAQYRVDGFVSIGNSTGICDTGTAETSYDNVFIAGCVGVDLYFLDEGRYTLTNVLVLSSAQNPFTVTGRAEGECRLSMENVLFRRLTEPRTAHVAKCAVLEAKNCTFENLDFKISGTVAWDNCLIDGNPAPAGSPTTGADISRLLELTPRDYQP